MDARIEGIRHLWQHTYLPYDDMICSHVRDWAYLTFDMGAGISLPSSEGTSCAGLLGLGQGYIHALLRAYGCGYASRMACR